MASLLFGLDFVFGKRNVAKTEEDHRLTSSRLVNEFIEAYEQSNSKYLSDNGESAILRIRGTVASITRDGEGKIVVLLKEQGDEAGVSCTFDHSPRGINKNDVVAIKGEIHLGAQYDVDLKMYENAILEHCTLDKT